MTCFKNFLLLGNHVELAVAEIVGVAFNDVVTTFTNWLTGLMPSGADKIFDNHKNSFGAFLNATVSFLILATVVYFFVVLPYTKAKERFFPKEEAGKPADVALLEEIRDLLAARNGAV